MADLFEFDGTDTRDMLEYAFDATPLDVRASLKTLDGKLLSCGLTRRARSDVLLALGEVLNNVVEHAYRDCDAGDINLKLHVHAGSVFVQISDNGTALPGNDIPDAASPDVDVPLEHLPEGGYGWAILGKIARDVTYRRKAAQNILSFHVPVTQGAQRSG